MLGFCRLPWGNCRSRLVMITLSAQKFSRGEVHRLLGLEPRLNGAFGALLALEPLAQDELDRIYVEDEDTYLTGRFDSYYKF
jgi:hypothetical protein